MASTTLAHEIVVIGAGISGIAFARFYLDIHPKTDIVLLDSDTHVGGVWSASRSFDSFWTQSGIRNTGFSDVAFTIPPNAPSSYDTCAAKYFTEYLEEYVSSHVYEGRSLRDRIHLQRKVVSVSKIHDSQPTQSTTARKWRIVSRGPGGQHEELYAAKLVIATGHTSIPIMPHLPGRESFGGPIHHHKDFGHLTRTDDGEWTRPDSEIQHIVVLGAGKSAADMVYDAVKSGKKRVSWVIRRTDSEGPALFFAPASRNARYLNSPEQASTRHSQLFSPSSFMPADHPQHSSIYKTTKGQNLAARRRANVLNHCISLPKYRDREGALPGFKDLEPTTQPFWVTGPLAMAQHDDFWDVIAKNVHVFRKDIKSLSVDHVILEDGQEVQADVILCGTGWRSDYPFLDPDLTRKLGLPHIPEEDSKEVKAQWDKLLREADEKVVSRFPVLLEPPAYREPSGRATTTSRLYNCIAPLDGPEGLHGDQSIAFVGHCEISNAFRAAEAQAIWATAYMDGNLKKADILPSPEHAREQVAYMNAFSRRRYPSRGRKGDCIFFELMWYTDYLMAELGLTSHRDGREWIDDWLAPNVAADYCEMVEEYKKRFETESKSEEAAAILF